MASLLQPDEWMPVDLCLALALYSNLRFLLSSRIPKDKIIFNKWRVNQVFFKLPAAGTLI